jgi:hypothetical protein
LIILILLLLWVAAKEDEMPTVYLRKDLYDSIVRQRGDPSAFVNKVVEDALKTRAEPQLPKEKESKTKTIKER